LVIGDVNPHSMRAGDRAVVGPDRGFYSPAVEPPQRGPSSGSQQRHYRTGSHFGVLARDSCRHETNSEPVAAHHPSPLVLARPVRRLAGPVRRLAGPVRRRVAIVARAEAARRWRSRSVTPRHKACRMAATSALLGLRNDFASDSRSRLPDLAATNLPCNHLPGCQTPDISHSRPPAWREDCGNARSPGPRPAPA
jgi:hypothetical protein